MDKHTDERTDRHTDGHTDGYTHRRKDGHSDGQSREFVTKDHFLLGNVKDEWVKYFLSWLNQDWHIDTILAERALADSLT